MMIAYSGIEGSFAGIATEKIFPDQNLLSCYTFREAYEQVEKGKCEACVLPIENSYAGEIGQVSDLMFAGTLKITGVYELHISQCLLGVKGSTAATIRKVISHPQALEQCGDYITRSGYETVPYENTARAAQKVAQQGDPALGAILVVGGHLLRGAAVRLTEAHLRRGHHGPVFERHGPDVNRAQKQDISQGRAPLSHRGPLSRSAPASS